MIKLRDTKIGRVVVGVDEFLGRHGLWVMLLFALVYYGLYFDTGLKLTGEQGSNALLAIRLLEGQRPIVDTFLGYNLMWFYPVAGIFWVLGPHWLAMRIYFLLLAVVTGLMGFSLVRRVTGWPWLAVVTAVFLILMPGVPFRNYMGFLGVLYAAVLVRAYVLEASSPGRQIAWMALAGAGLSLAFLIRIEPSLLVGLMWLGLVVLYPFGHPGQWLSRARTVALGTVAALAAFAVVHAPFVVDAYQRGFGTAFTGQYSAYFKLLRWELEQEFTRVAEPVSAAASTRETSAGSPEVAGEEFAAEQLGDRDGRVARPPIADITGRGRLYFFALAIWFPVLLAAVFVAVGAISLLVSLLRQDPVVKRHALVILTTTGSALALFPQYFFFRPDSVHLNEFMVPFWVASACSGWAVLQLARLSGRRWMHWGAGAVAVLVALQFVVSFNGLFYRIGSGSIIAAQGLDARFHAPHGIVSRVKARELADWEGLRDAVAAHSAPGDYVITYPYVPIINLMAGRPSYQYNLYADNATASPRFLEEQIRRLRTERPAVVVVNNRAINQTEYSRFRTWAAPVYEVITADYVQVGEFFGEIEVYVRPDKVRNGSD